MPRNGYVGRDDDVSEVVVTNINVFLRGNNPDNRQQQLLLQDQCAVGGCDSQLSFPPRSSSQPLFSPCFIFMESRWARLPACKEP